MHEGVPTNPTESNSEKKLTDVEVVNRLREFRDLDAVDQYVRQEDEAIPLGDQKKRFWVGKFRAELYERADMMDVACKELMVLRAELAMAGTRSEMSQSDIDLSIQSVKEKEFKIYNDLEDAGTAAHERKDRAEVDRLTDMLNNIDKAYDEMVVESSQPR